MEELDAEGQHKIANINIGLRFLYFILFIIRDRVMTTTIQIQLRNKLSDVENTTGNVHVPVFR